MIGRGEFDTLCRRVRKTEHRISELETQLKQAQENAAFALRIAAGVLRKHKRVLQHFGLREEQVPATVVLTPTAPPQAPDARMEEK